MYVFLWPALVYRVLKVRQHKMHVKGLGGHMTRSTYGFLYRGYSAKRFYWEIVIMMRKVLMVIVATVGLRATVQTQGMLALLVISISLAAHLQFKPFDEPSLDRLELYGLITAFIILYRYVCIIFVYYFFFYSYFFHFILVFFYHQFL